MRPDPPYRTTIRSITPSEVTRYIWAQCHTGVGFNDQELLACEPPISEKEAQSMLATYVADRDVSEQLRAWMSELGLAISVAENLLNEVADLATRVETALE